MDLKFVNNSYFEQLFQSLRPKLQYSKNIIFVTSHFGTLLLNIVNFRDKFFEQQRFRPSLVLILRNFSISMQFNFFELEKNRRIHILSKVNNLFFLGRELNTAC